MNGLAEAAAEAPGLVDAAVFAVGACIGSFLNVVITRVPKGESIVRPPSHCACGQPIAWRDNVPLLSWVLLRGRARCCGRRISARYPAVELLTAAAFTACWILLPPAVAVCGWVFLGALVAATCIDLEHMIIPDGLTIGLGVAGIALSAFVPALHGFHGGFYPIDCLRSEEAAGMGLLMGSGLVLWIGLVAGAVLRKEAMGFGDVKFVGAIGAFCGWHGAVFAIFGGAALGSLAVCAALLWRAVSGGKGPAVGMGRHIPFGPMLAAAAALYFLALHGPVDDWFAQTVAAFPS